MNTPYTGLMNQALSSFASIESEVVEQTKMNLVQRVVGLWRRSDDDIFSAHTTYAVECWRAGIPELASRIWESALSHEAAAADTALARMTPPDRIHKGAPLYNSGFGYLLAGNLDRAIALISEAGSEESLKGNAAGNRLLLGDHELTEKSVLTPLATWLGSTTVLSDYRDITSHVLDITQLKSTVNWLCTKIENALQFIVSLLRLKSTTAYTKTDAVRHIRVQTLADLLLVVESSLRAWQPGTVSGQLYSRLEPVLGVNEVALRAFKAAESRFATQFPKDPVTRQDHPDKETHVAVNWEISDTLSALTTADSVAERAGVACHLVARLRNSLMHVIDGSIDMYSKDVEYDRVLGIVLAVIRLSQSGNDGTLSDLPTN
jgi:hypothetical protein